MKLDYERHTAARMFDSSFLERSSRVHPATPFVFYLPLVLALSAWGLATHRTTPLWTLAGFPAGWVLWQALEYLIHRHFFHWEGNGPFTRKIHEIAHGYHHRYPDDFNRLVMPLGASLPLAVVFAGLFWAVHLPALMLPAFVGLVSGYLWYDFIHWSTHARTPLTAWGKAQRAHHMAHHFACPDKNYGISHRWVDGVVGSLRKREDRAE